MTVVSTTIDASVLIGEMPAWKIKYFQLLSNARIAEAMKEIGLAHQLRGQAEKLKQENDRPIERPTHEDEYLKQQPIISPATL